MLQKLVGVTATLMAASTASAAFMSNGDFESVGTEPQTFTNWTEDGNVASVASTPISGSSSAKLVKATGSSNMAQTLNDPDNKLTKFVYETDFATSDPGDGTKRSLHVNLRYGSLVSTQTQINLRVVDLGDDGDGDVEVFNGSNWTAVALSNLNSSVKFSASESALEVNHLKIVGDFTAAQPQYDIYVTGPNGSFSQTGITAFHGTAPTAGVTALNFATFETGNTVGWVVVDNTSVTAVPEPAALGMLGLAGVALRRRRRD